MADVKQELPVKWWRHDPQGWIVFCDILALLPQLGPEQQEVFARALPPDVLLSALCALEGPERANMLAELRWDDRGGKYFTKARVYGAIACQYREALEKLRGVSEVARNALTRRDTGVPVEQLEAFEKLMRAEEERDAAIKRAEEAEERRNCAVANNAEWNRRYQLLSAENEKLRAELEI